MLGDKNHLETTGIDGSILFFDCCLGPFAGNRFVLSNFNGVSFHSTTENLEAEVYYVNQLFPEDVKNVPNLHDWKDEDAARKTAVVQRTPILRDSILPNLTIRDQFLQASMLLQ